MGGREAAPGVGRKYRSWQAISRGLPGAGWSSPWLAPPGPWLPGKILYGAGLPQMSVPLLKGLPYTRPLGHTTKLRAHPEQGNPERQCPEVPSGNTDLPITDAWHPHEGATTTLGAFPSMVHPQHWCHRKMCWREGVEKENEAVGSAPPRPTRTSGIKSNQL